MSVPQALEGIRILVMEDFVVLPWASMLLGDMGAEVIRSEAPTRLVSRQFSPFPEGKAGPEWWNESGSFDLWYRNKKSLVLNIQSPEGKEIFHELVKISDVVASNFRSDVMERLGLSYGELRKLRPDLIMVNVTGFGQTGPWNYYRGIGTQFEASVGHATVTGYPDMGTDGAPGSVAADAACGVTIGLVATMALHQREKTGKGVYIDISLGENFLPQLGELYMDYSINGRVAGPIGNRDHLGNLVQGVYQCAGDDEWIAISIANIDEWNTLTNIMKIDNKFGSMQDLMANHDTVDTLISEWTSSQDPVKLFHELQSKGIMAGHIMHEEHVFSDPQIKERDFFVQITHPEAGTHLYPSTTYKMSKVAFEVRKPPMRLGEDNDYVYREIIKLTEDEYQYLKDQGHIGMDYAAHVR